MNDASSRNWAFAHSVFFCSILNMPVRALDKEMWNLTWSQEIERRVNDIESGKVKGFSANQAMAKARHALNEARNISSALRK
jgi:hypothetical protein